VWLFGSPSRTPSFRSCANSVQRIPVGRVLTPHSSGTITFRNSPTGRGRRGTTWPLPHSNTPFWNPRTKTRCWKWRRRSASRPLPVCRSLKSSTKFLRRPVRLALRPRPRPRPLLGHPGPPRSPNSHSTSTRQKGGSHRNGVLTRRRPLRNLPPSRTTSPPLLTTASYSAPTVTRSPTGKSHCSPTGSTRRSAKSKPKPSPVTTHRTMSATEIATMAKPANAAVIRYSEINR
jgi:hypothetical protein